MGGQPSVAKSRRERGFKHAHADRIKRLLHLLDIEEGKCDRLPHVHAVLARDLEVLVPLLLDQRVVLDRHRVPHDVAL